MVWQRCMCNAGSGGRQSRSHSKSELLRSLDDALELAMDDQSVDELDDGVLIVVRRCQQRVADSVSF